jgi:ribosomal protein L9
MKVLLLADIQGHGKKGNLADVNDGYAKNYLIPKKLATEATKQVIHDYNLRLEKEARLAKEERDAAMELYNLLNTKIIDVKVKTGGGKMYGSVTAQDIASSLAEQGITVDKKKITIKEQIKSPGQYVVEVWVYPETVAKMKINIIAQN